MKRKLSFENERKCVACTHLYHP